MKRSLLEQVLLYDYRYVLGAVAVVLAAAYFLLWRIGSLLPGLGFHEANYLVSFASVNDILQAPLYWPHKVLSLMVQQQLGVSELGFRLVSASFAAIGLAAFFAVVRERFRTRIAIAAVGLLATSSWWLAYARAARPEILLPASVFVLMYVARKVYETRKRRWLILLMTFLPLVVYIPLMLYVVTIGFVALKPVITRVAAEFSPILRGGLGIWVAVLLAPLIWAVANEPGLGRELLGLPESVPGLVETLRNISNGIAELFWSSSDENWSLRVGDLPLLDLFTAIMLALGLYHLDQEVSRSLAHFVLSGLGILLIVTRLANNPAYNALLIPFIYLLVAAGVVMLVSQWYDIFPRNPIARLTAFLPTLILLAAVMGYHHQRYFVAWAGAPQILTAYPPLSRPLSLQLSNLSQTPSPRVFLVVTEEEVALARLTSRPYPNVVITTIPSAVSFDAEIVLSDKAYTKLEPEFRKRLGGSERPLPSAYATQPIALWYYQPAHE